MTVKIEVTDEMAIRAEAEFRRIQRDHGVCLTPMGWVSVVKAALNPPKPAEEIPVSKAMIDAAIQPLAVGNELANEPLWRAIERDDAEAMYRRMESQRRKEESEAALKGLKPKCYERSHILGATIYVSDERAPGRDRRKSP